MLARGFRLSKATDFTRTYKYGKSYNHSNFYIKALVVQTPSSRFAVVVPKKISKRAVDRNRTRRRIYEIIRVNYAQIKPGYTIIITAKANIASLSPKQLEGAIIGGLKKLFVIS